MACGETEIRSGLLKGQIVKFWPSDPDLRSRISIKPQASHWAFQRHANTNTKPPPPVPSEHHISTGISSQGTALKQRENRSKFSACLTYFGRDEDEVICRFGSTSKMEGRRGDLVRVTDQNLPRSQWCLGCIIESMKGKDERIILIKSGSRILI